MPKCIIIIIIIIIIIDINIIMHNFISPPSRGTETSIAQLSQRGRAMLRVCQ